MKARNPIALLIGWITLGLAPATMVHSADASGENATSGGVIRGRVINAATGDFLAGVTVEIVGTNISVLTDLGGNFRAARVPAGEQLVRVRYTGLNAETITARVLPGQTVEVPLVKLTSDIYQMEKVVVGGLREGNALAITYQKNADNVKNVVAADTFGNIADGNPGDLLQYLPGVSADYVGNEVRTIQIRGMAPEMGTVTVDGTRMASSQSANLGRQFEYETASLGNVETVELNKALLPDMEADAVSGSVNLRSKSALDGSPDRRIFFNFGATLSPENNVPGYSPLGISGSLTYSEVVGRRKNFGIVFSASYHKSDSPSFQTGQNYQATTASPAYTFQVIAPRPAPGPRRRTSSNLKLEYQLSERARFDVRFGFNTMLETSHPRQFTLNAANSVAILNAAGQPTGTGGILPGYTDLTSEARQQASTTAAFTESRFPKRGRTFIVGSGGRYRAEGIEVTWNGSYSYSDTRYQNSNITMSLPNIGWRVTRAYVGDPFPQYVQTAGPDMYNLANYTNFVYNRTNNEGYDDILAFRADAKKDLNTAFPAYVKVGANYRSQTRDIDRRYWSSAYTGSQPLTRFLDQDWDYNRRLGPSGAYRSPPFPGIEEATEVYEKSPNDFTLNVANSISVRLLNDKRMNEDVGAAYAMGGLTLGELSLVGGARVEHTQDDGVGPRRQVTAEEAARRAAFVGPLTSVEIERRTIAEYGNRQRNQSEYTDLFPSVHAKYSILPGFLARASWATGIGRPSFADIIPSLTVNEIAETVSGTNPGLKPHHAENIDVSLEYYFEPVGVFSVGYFHKKLTDFIFSDTHTISTGADNGFEGEYAGYTLTSTANGGFGTVKGYEINYSQQLSKLPGLISRFGVYANYTRNKTEGNYDSGGTTVQSTNEIVGFIPETGNVGISYLHRRLDLRVQWNYRGRYLVAYSSNPASLRFAQPRILVHLRTKFRLYKNYSVYFDVLNLFNEPGTNNYIFAPSRPLTYRLESPRYYGGISGTY